MLSAIVRFSIRFRGVVIALSFLAVAYGLSVALQSRLGVFPEFAPPQVVVQTEAPGLSPEQVEQLVTLPVELALRGTAELAALRSDSIQGLSVVTAVFRDGTDVFRDRQLAAERLAGLSRELPREANSPQIEPLTTATSLVLMAGLVSPSLSPGDLRSFAEYTVKPELLGLPGVAKVVLFGGEIRELQFQADPDKLQAYGISFQEAVDALSKATAIRGAGFIETAAQRVIIQTHGQALDAAGLAGIVARRSQGLTVRFGDLGRVVDGGQAKTGDAQIMGQPGVLIEVSGQYGVNALDVGQSVEDALLRLKPAAEAAGIRIYPGLFRPAGFIRRALGSLANALWLGGLLVCAVVLLFLWNVRTSLISLTAIPLSLLLAVVCLDSLGMTINTLTLGGLAIAIGEVVDDAIIDVENIHRRLRENSRKARPLGRLKVVYSASLEVRTAVVYATVVVLFVFLPVIRLGGVQGKLFAPLGWAYIFSILASLAVALSLTPALCSVLLSDQAMGKEAEVAWLARLKGSYHKLLGPIMRHPLRAGSVAALALAAALSAVPFLGGEFLPQFREGHYILHMTAAPGTSLRESMRLGTRVTAELAKLPEVQWVAQQTGRAENSDDVAGPQDTELHLELKPEADDKAGEEARLREVASRFPGVNISVKTFLAERIEEVISGSTAQVVVKLFGNDLEALDLAAGQVGSELSRIPGAVEVQAQAEASVPELSVNLDSVALARFGFQPAGVLAAVQTASQGSVAAQIFQGNRITNVVGILEPGRRVDPESLGSLRLRNPDGEWVALSRLARLSELDGRYSVPHEDAQRVKVVSCNVQGRDLTSFAAEAGRRVAALKLPNQVLAVLGGTSTETTRARADLLRYFLLAMGAILLLLWMVFQNGWNMALVLVNLPFAMVGGVLAVLATGGSLSLGSLVGFVTLFGITMRNSIMLISHYGHLVEQENEEWGPQAALRGSAERLVPILMTALVTALGLLPIALGSGRAGQEIEGPMAVVILGGLVTSTAMNLLLLPAFALRWGRFKRPRHRETI